MSERLVSLSGADVMRFLQGEDGVISPSLPRGTRVVARSRPGSAAARYALVPWPELTVRLSELGFALEDGTREGGGAQQVCRLAARKTDVSVRGFRRGDAEAIRELFARSFHQPLSPETWRWRYVEHPHGAHRITVAHGADGRLLGHYGGYPVVLRSDEGTTLHAHQNGDVMTDRSARRLGHEGASIVGRMARHFWAAYGENRVDFHYGFNTGTAFDLQTRIVPGVRALETVTAWTLDAGSRTGHLRADALEVSRVSTFDAEWDAFAQRVSPAYGVLTRRDAMYLNWRYAVRPFTDYVLLQVRDHGRLVGGGVFRCDTAETLWGDALVDSAGPRETVHAMLAHLLERGAPSRVRGWFPSRPDWWVRTLALEGFRPVPDPQGLTLVYAPFTSGATRFVPELYYTWGDSDLF